MSNAIKLKLQGEDTFGRDSWYGWGPFKAKVNDDDSLTITVPGEDPQIIPVASNDYGPYWTVNLAEGKAFARIVDHEKYGTYLRLKLSDQVNLPAEVAAKANKNKKPQARAPKKTGTSGMWTKK